jgi:hypothetical protein
MIRLPIALPSFQFVLAAMVLLAASAEGRGCVLSDVVFERGPPTPGLLWGTYPGEIIVGHPATIPWPSDCTSLNLRLTWLNGEAGATAIAAALQVNTALTSLNLRFDNIGDAGATAIAAALQVNTVLTSLDLYYNNIGDAGATAIAAALQVNTALTTLDLGGNTIGVAGATAIAAALQVNTALTTLDLGHNTIGATAIASIATCLKENANPSGSLRADRQAAEAAVHAEKEAATKAAEENAAKKEVAINTFRATLESNPCGPRAGCEDVLGTVILARFLELLQFDAAKLHDFGVTSAMDLLLLGAFHKEHTHHQGKSTDPNFDLTKPSVLTGPSYGYHALQSLVIPLKLLQREKLIVHLAEKSGIGRGFRLASLKIRAKPH